MGDITTASPSISIIITSFNQKQYLANAIESVLKQTVPPHELVIVDDSSTDGSTELIQQYARRFPHMIRPFFQSRNIGIPRNRNFGLSKATGDLVVFLDGDDRFLPQKLELELETLKQHPEASVVFSNIYYVDEGGHRLCKWDEKGTTPTGCVLRENFSRSWPRGNLYRNELMPLQAIKEVGLFDESLQIYEDWDLKIRLSSMCKVAYCPIPLVEYRRHPLGISSTSSVELHLDVVRRIYEKNRHLLNILPKKDHEEAEKKLLAFLLYLEAKLALEKSRRGIAIMKYAKYLRKNPDSLRDFPSHLRFLLPRKMYANLKSIYGSTRLRS